MAWFPPIIIPALPVEALALEPENTEPSRALIPGLKEPCLLLEGNWETSGDALPLPISILISGVGWKEWYVCDC